MSRLQMRGLVMATGVALVVSGCGMIKVKGNLLGLNKTSVKKANPTSRAQRAPSRTSYQPASRGRPARQQWQPQIVPGEGYQGAECSRVLADMSQIKRSYHAQRVRRRTDPSVDTQIYLLVCARQQKSQRGSRRSIIQPATVHPLNVTPLHYAFDDRRPNLVHAALISIYWGNLRIGPKARRLNPLLMGLANAYAKLVDAQKLQAQLGELKIAPEATKLFIARFEKAKANIVQQIAAIAPALKPMMVALPQEILGRRQGYFAKYAQFYTQLDALMAEGKKARAEGTADGVVAKLINLRSKYMSACGQRAACRYTPVFTLLSRDIAMGYVAMKDPMGARLESSPYVGQGRYVVTFAQELSVAQSAAGKKLSVIHRKYKQAKQRGVDDATARNVAGGEGYNFYSRTMLIAPKSSMSDYGAALGRNKARSFKAVVKGLKRTSKGVKVTFKKLRYKIRVPYACRRTRRVSRIRRDGRLEYEQICKWRSKMQVREVAKPVVLPKADAKFLRPGDELRGLRLEDQGRVIQVDRKKKTVQLGRDRVRG